MVETKGIWWKIMKDIYDLLRICNENSGKVLKTPEILELFGYSIKSSIFQTKVIEFLFFQGYIHPSNYWKIGSWVLLSYKELREYEPEERQAYFEASKISKNLYLYDKNKVEWWNLKEYGGNL